MTDETEKGFLIFCRCLSFLFIYAGLIVATNGGWLRSLWAAAIIYIGIFAVHPATVIDRRQSDD